MCNSVVIHILQNILLITLLKFVLCIVLDQKKKKKKKKAVYIYAKKLRALYDVWHALHIKLLC